MKEHTERHEPHAQHELSDGLCPLHRTTSNENENNFVIIAHTQPFYDMILWVQKCCTGLG
jgi:hypothetical protein